MAYFARVYEYTTRPRAHEVGVRALELHLARVAAEDSRHPSGNLADIVEGRKRSSLG